MALGRIGRDARGALPELRKTLKDKYTDVRVRAAIAIWKVDGQVDEVLPVLIEALQRKAGNGPEEISSWEIAEVTEVLGEMGARTKSAVPVVIPLLKHESWNIRRSAREALKKIDPEAAKKEGIR
jgi:HEAT repeat protein